MDNPSVEHLFKLTLLDNLYYLPSPNAILDLGEPGGAETPKKLRLKNSGLVRDSS